MVSAVEWRGGVPTSLDRWEEALTTGTEGVVELAYAYSPALISSPNLDVRGLWRYRRLLPLSEGTIQYPLTVGDTPLYPAFGLRVKLGMPQLWIKDETRGPTGSNKDRATALVIEHGLRTGATTVTAASTGNVAASLAVGAAASGLRAVIFVPATVAEAKLAVMLLAGATVIKVQRGYDAAFELSRQAATRFGWLDRNTGVNPLTLEAKKTVAFEIWEQLDRTMPDVVVAPVGDGPTLSALAKGFRELVACGAAGTAPRLIGVQAEGCRPLVEAWATGNPVRAVEANTIADGIAVGKPVCGDLVLRDVRASSGGLISVSDEALKDAMRDLASAGVLAEPAGAAAYAGLLAALDSGMVHRDELATVLITGTVLKTLQYAQPTTSAAEIDGDLDDVERVVSLLHAD